MKTFVIHSPSCRTSYHIHSAKLTTKLNEMHHIEKLLKVTARKVQSNASSTATQCCLDDSQPLGGATNKHTLFLNL